MIGEFHSVVDEEYVLVGYDAVMVGDFLSTFRRSSPLQSSPKRR